MLPRLGVRLCVRRTITVQCACSDHDISQPSGCALCDSRVEIQRSNLKSSHCIAGDATDGRTDGRGRQMQESSDKTFIQEHFGTRRTSHMLCCELQGIVVKKVPFRSLVRFEE